MWFFVFREIVDIGGVCRSSVRSHCASSYNNSYSLNSHSTEQYYETTFFKGDDTRKFIVDRFLNCLNSIFFLFFFLIRTQKNSRADKKITSLLSNNVYSSILYGYTHYSGYFSLIFFRIWFHKMMKSHVDVYIILFIFKNVHKFKNKNVVHSIWP